jgi:hypothetical protein
LHNEKNIILELGKPKSEKYKQGERYHHKEMNVLCSILERIEEGEGEERKLQKLKMRNEKDSSEFEIEEKDFEQLKEYYKAEFRVLF